MNTIWHILLTVCLDRCINVSQDIQWFESEKQCRIMRKEYEAMPKTANGSMSGHMQTVGQSMQHETRKADNHLAIRYH